MEESGDSNVRGRLLLIVLIGLALRLGWSLSRPVSDAAVDALPDQREYLEIARNVLHGEFGFFDPRFEKVVLAYRTPGYPLFVAACRANVRIIQVTQCLIDASTILAVFILARVWINGRLALLAAGFVAINPLLIFFCPLVLSETLFTAILAWAMVLLLVPNRVNVRILAGTVLLAIGVMVRPSAMLLPAVMAMLGVFVRPPGEGKRMLPPVATALAITLLVLAPWATRNRVVLGRWIWTSTNSGITEYDGFNPDADGRSDQSFVRSMPWLKSMSELERDEYLGHKAADFARGNPQRSAELALLHVARTWSPIPLSREYSSARNIAAGLLYTLPLDVLAIIGLAGVGIPRAAKWFLGAPAVYLTVIHAISIGSLRYRLPAEPAMAVLAAAGVSYLLGRREQRGGPLSQ